MPYAKLGPAVGLSQAAVRQRVQRLIESGVMQVVAVTDPIMVGFSLQAMIGVRARPRANSFTASGLASRVIMESTMLSFGQALQEIAPSANFSPLRM